MNKEDQIDEIDWLISELEAGTFITTIHRASFEAMDIEFPYENAERARFGGIIRVLKNKRESLL